MAARAYADCYRKLNSAPGYTCHLSVDKLRAAYPDVADAVDPAADVAWRILRAKYPDIHEKLATSAEAVRSLLKERIDYIFADPPLARGLTGCIVDDSPEAYRASDHLPVIATFDLQQAGSSD